MADFRNTTNQLSSAKRIKTGLRSQPLVTTAPEYRQKSLNIFRIRHTQVQKLAVNLSLDTDEIDSIERDRLLGLDAKFTSRTKAKKFIKIEELLLNRSKFSEVDFCFMGDEGSDTKAISLSKSLSKYHSLKDVTLNFLWCQNLSQNGIRSLAKNLLKLNHLNDLSIAYKNFYKGDQFITGLSSTAQTFQRYFSQTQLVLSLHENNIGYQFKGTNTQPQNEDLDGLSFSYTRSLTSSDDPKKLLSQLKKLTTSLSKVVSIKLDFQGWNQLNNADLVVLKELINDLPHLSTIELNLAKCNDITDIGMFILRDILTNKPNLKHLKLGLANLYLTDNGVLALAEAILSLRKLHSLDLDFSGLQKITSVAILGQILTQLDLLESLVVQFEGCGKITDEEIKLIQFSHNKVHQKMKKMVLNFKACKEITNEGIKDLSLGIESLKKLEHFSLCLNRCPRITDEGLKQLADTMSQNFHNLIGIALSFSTCQKITDEGISYLASVIGESNLYLEQIDLQFSLCHEVTFKGLETTLNSLSKQLKKLKKLSLDFSSCAKITDEALKELKSDLEIYFEALQELSLCLSSKQVSESGLNSIMTLFKNLNRLSIQLKRSQLLTDEGVKRLGSHIMMQFDKLKKLDLDFESCELISDEGIKKLVSEFVSRLKSLESFSLNLSKCNQVTKDIKGHVKRTLSFLPEINL